MNQTDSDQAMQQLFRTAHTIAVIGLSPKTDRPSYRVAAYLKEQGYRIIPVNPQCRDILGETCYPSLAEVPAEITIDIVDVFRRAEDTPPLATTTVERGGVRAFWLQSEIISEEAMAIVRQAGLMAVQDRCLMVEHRRLMAG
ncbi:MAG: CoA-binding protein [Magnetococcales bacterium]|nr:CoA-binding protein [Magnetococcales bacterium]